MQASDDHRIAVTDNLDLLLVVLPPRLRREVERQRDLASLLEVVVDLGRQPEARFPERTVALSPEPINREDLDYMAARIGTFTRDNRAGIEGTLHRISALRNRVGEIVGLTCRVGRAVYGTVDIVRDVVESGRSVLLLGRPGVGKTTLLREAARVLADDLNKRVVIVDTSNEIAGDGNVPHPGIGRARRMQVPSPEHQHATMIEAVENHMPEVVVIDEIGTEAEAHAARTIAERGVQLVATAHGITLENLIANPVLADLVGGIQTVTLGDEEARRRRTQKTVLERKAPPTFDILIEIRDRDRFAVHIDVAAVVDALLRGVPAQPQLRVRCADGRVSIEAPLATVPPLPVYDRTRAAPQAVRIFPYAVSRAHLDRAIRDLGVAAVVSSQPRNADIVVTLRSLAKKQPKKLRELVTDSARVHAIGGNTPARVTQFLREFFELPSKSAEQDAALKEAEDAIAAVVAHGEPVALGPQHARFRRLQHQLAEAHGLGSASAGHGPLRRVVIQQSKKG